MPGSFNLPKMAQSEAIELTNYVRLKDPAAYVQFAAAVALLGGEVGESKETDGSRLICAYARSEDGRFRESVNVEELVESGYVSPHAGSLLDATRPEYLALVADWELNADEDLEADGEADLLHELYPLLAPGQVLTFQSVSHEKRTSVHAWAQAISEHGQRVIVSLDEAIHEKAAAAFVRPQGKPQEAEPLYSRINEHPYFDYAMWQAEVAAGDSQRSYARWVTVLLEQTREELERAEEAFDRNGGRGIEEAEQIDELRAKLGENCPDEDED